ncbi:MAG: hypothetical protein MZV70_33500 [Desulfobacterales bacterium]|nr:hypothetical protein [Desulfobacterales bacterium]
MEISKPPFKFRVLERINALFDFTGAASVLLEATREIAGEVAAGVYSLDDDGYSLILGNGVPVSMKALPRLELISRSPLYVRTRSIFPGLPPEGLPLEVSLLPLHGSGSFRRSSSLRSDTRL